MVLRQTLYIPDSLETSLAAQTWYTVNFAPLVRLQKLDLSMNKISNVTSLRTLPNLPELKLRVILTGNPIHQAHILSLREELMNVMIDF